MRGLLGEAEEPDLNRVMDLKSFQERSCLPNLPEMPAPPVCFPEVAPVSNGKPHVPGATEKGPKHPLDWHAT